MLRVMTSLKTSQIHGIGVFAEQFIPAGTVVQDYHPDYDSCHTRQEVAGLDEVGQEFIRRYAYLHKEMDWYVLCADNARFLNHSINNNLKAGLSGLEQDVAARDIYPGEELTVNYFDFDAEAAEKLKL